MAYASRTYAGAGGGAQTFALTNTDGNAIGYIREADIRVTVGTTVYTNAASGTNTYQFSGTSTLEQPSGGNIVLNASTTAAVTLERTTGIQTATVTYTAGSTLTSSDLNNADNQIRFGLQEFSDIYDPFRTGTGDLAALDGIIGGSETWTSSDAFVATTSAIDTRVGTTIDTALTTDVSGGDGVTIVDNSPGAGQIRIDLDADIATLRNMQTGAATALALLTSTEIAILDGASLSTAELNYVDGVTSAIQTQLNNKQPLATDLTNLSSMQSGASTELATLTAAELEILDGLTASTTELNLLDGVPGTLTTTEIGYLDGVTSSIQTQLDAKQSTNARIIAIGALDVNDGNIIVGNGTTWVAENGATARTSLGAQAAAADLTNLSSCQTGASAAIALLTSAEVEILDGATPSTTELNYVDGVTSAIQGQLDGKQPLDAELTTLSGMTSNTASVLADNTASLGATLAEINSICENRGSQTTITNSDAHIPTSGAVVDYVTGSVSAVGGLIAIATDAAFPETSDQPANGVVVSISNAGGMVVSSNSSTTGRTTDSTPAQVTVNTFPNTLNGQTLTDGVGLQVVSTGSSNTYTYQKLLVKEADVIQLSDDINEFNERYRTDNTGTNPTSNNHAGDLYFNQGTNTMLVRNAANSAWQEVQSSGDFFINTFASLGSAGDTVPGGSATPNGTAQKFTLSNAGSVTQQHLVSVNGVIQQPSSSGSVSSAPSNGFVVDGAALVLASAPPSGATLFVVTIGASVNIGAPSANTVGLSQLQSAAVTDAKVATNAAIAVSKLADFTANDANNRILTATGTKNSYNGEANLTFDGNFLTQTIDAAGEGIRVTAAGNHWTSFIGDSNRSAPNTWVSYFGGKWNGNTIGAVGILTGADDTNKDEGAVGFYTTPSGGSETERARIDSSGRLLIGTTASRSANSAQGAFQIEGTGAEDSDMSIIRNQANSGGPSLVLGKSRNASLAGNTIVQDDDQLGTLVFVGNDGTDLTSQGARIDAYVDGTPGSDDMPGRLVFSTTADGASSPTERLRIDSSGKVGIGTDTPDSVLGVQGAQGYADSASTLATSTTKSAFRVKGSNNSSDSLWMGVETVAANPYIQGANGNGSASKDLLLNPFGGDVGIGVTAAGLKLHIQDGALASAPTPNSNCDVVIEGTTNTGIQFLSSGQTQLRFGDAASTAAGAIIYEHSGDLLKLNYSNSGATTFNDGTGEVARFTPDGLTFNGDTAAANALDDYEEGTWTIAFTAPTTNPSYTLTAGVCNYRKVGQIVHFTINLQFNSWSDGSGNLQWSLPFAARAGTSQWQGCGNIIYANGFESGAGDGGTYGCYVDPGASIFYVRKSDSNTSVVQATEMATSYSHHYIGYGTYVVD